MNTTQFEDLFLSADWSSYMISIIWLNSEMLGGAAVLLGALYNYNMTELVNDPNLIHSAAKAKQRYFGEVLQAALGQPGSSQHISTKGHVNAIESRVVVQAGPAIALGVLFAISFFLLVAVWWLSQHRRRPLNLRRDPATAVGVAYLVTQNERSRAGFQVLRQPDSKYLEEKIGKEYYYIDSQGLSRGDSELPQDHDSIQSENGTPALLRLPVLLVLVLILALVIVGVAVLYHYAESYRLYGKAFVYQVQLSFLGNGMSSVAPFSMIPTVIATLIGLWWGAIDDNFRRLQPFLSMSKNDPPCKQGADLSYQSSYWMWAAGKAAFNRHWLLFLVALGSTLSPVFTTTMSALFERGTGNIIRPVDLERQLEVREIPFIFETMQSTYPGGLTTSDYTATILGDLYKNISSYWMYTATIQLALNGSEPAWSKDGWNFVPLDLSNITSADSLASIGASKPDSLSSETQTNVTFNTPAIRGRIECSQPPVEALANVSNWLTPTYLTNHKLYNQTTVPANLEGGYELGASHGVEHQASQIIPLLPSQNLTECPGCTNVFVNPSQIMCCGNSSTNSRQGDVGVGYWSPNHGLAYMQSTPRQWQRNFTTKWIHGEAVTGIKIVDTLGYPDPALLFPEPPSMSLFNCRPIVESANAKVTVDSSNGNVQTFSILSDIQEETEPWLDNFLPIMAHQSSMIMAICPTIYGRLFTATMLSSADILHISGSDHSIGYTVEDLRDNTYTIRDQMKGLNMDFMTYSMYSMAGKDPKALLDPDTFTHLAQKTYTTFFQHFISKNISMETGGWGYQKINASLPASLQEVVDIDQLGLPGKTASKYQDKKHPISHTNRTVQVHVSQEVELLQMNTVAVGLSIGILGWLVLTTAVVALAQKHYFGSLVRNVESLGDVLVLIAGSANFLQVVREIEAGRLSPDDYENLRTRLGWFMDEEGHLRWGIEMEQSYGEGPDVNWVTKPTFSKEKGASTWNLADEQNV
ncbi:hypothetical protein N7468_004080 [Penicillium chermesinum]|uniref:Uncharacterized protein n=1 Tax=Penicillium chermesinum TaxID=63820 RepID=A0A9W9P7L0_9EURO|nr:uncharacterized protein N7468_004080 [Penicillium chermesinum]KAJ5239461.1 hypothetical protein N7468_004080 [Penicillium chermesinum]